MGVKGGPGTWLSTGDCQETVVGFDQCGMVSYHEDEQLKAPTTQAGPAPKRGGQAMAPRILKTTQTSFSGPPIEDSTLGRARAWPCRGLSGKRAEFLGEPGRVHVWGLPNPDGHGLSCWREYTHK